MERRQDPNTYFLRWELPKDALERSGETVTDELFDDILLERDWVKFQ